MHLQRCHTRGEPVSSGTSITLLQNRINVYSVKSFSLLTYVYHVRLHQVRIRRPTLALKPRGDVTRNPKQGVSVAPQIDMYPTRAKRKFNLNFRRKILEHYPYPEQELIFRSIYIGLCWRVSYMKLILKLL